MRTSVPPAELTTGCITAYLISSRSFIRNMIFLMLSAIISDYLFMPPFNVSISVYLTVYVYHLSCSYV